MMELGAQPLERILTDLNLSGTDLVQASTEQLSYKMIQKGRKGRRLTINVQMKILRALNLASKHEFSLKDLFNY